MGFCVPPRSRLVTSTHLVCGRVKHQELCCPFGISFASIRYLRHLCRVACVTRTPKVHQMQVFAITFRTAQYVKERAPCRCISIKFADCRRANRKQCKGNAKQIDFQTFFDLFLLKKSFSVGEKAALIVLGAFGRLFNNRPACMRLDAAWTGNVGLQFGWVHYARFGHPRP